MTQNIYDDPEFFAGYSQLKRSREGLDGMPEWPTLRAMLPAIKGLRVVDLGCGFGWFCRWAREQGAATVLGLDLSENMLARARETTADPAISYRSADLETVDLPSAAFDLAHSALTLHYLTHLDRLFATVHRALVPGGRFVFSMEHPFFTAHGPEYLDEGPRATDWLAKGVVRQHRTLATILNRLAEAGFAVRQVEEWGATREQMAAHPEWKIEHRQPSFLLVAAGR